MLKKILEFLFSKYFAQSWKQGYLQAQADDRCERIRGRIISPLKTKNLSKLCLNLRHKTRLPLKG